MKKNDIMLIILSLSAAALLYFILNKSSHGGDTVRIYSDGKLFAEKKLSENCVIDINGTNIAEIHDGKCFMKYADCPDKLCISQGSISDSSKKIVCLPNKVMIEITGKSDIDTVVK